MDSLPPKADEARTFAEARRNLLEALRSEVRHRGGGGIYDLDDRILQAMNRVPRERFVPEALRGSAYANRPLAIGHGQTISQPLVVALMTQHLGLDEHSRVLEVGTGSGYQTAILAEIAAEVVTIETVPELAAGAKEVLSSLGSANITFRIGDGALGAPDLAPFSAILVTAAAPRLPLPLLDQLGRGGRMVIPVGQRRETQQLKRLTKDAKGQITETSLFSVAFVPLVQGGSTPEPVPRGLKP